MNLLAARRFNLAARTVFLGVRTWNKSNEKIIHKNVKNYLKNWDNIQQIIRFHAKKFSLYRWYLVCIPQKIPKIRIFFDKTCIYCFNVIYCWQFLRFLKHTWKFFLIQMPSNISKHFFNLLIFENIRRIAQLKTFENLWRTF